MDRSVLEREKRIPDWLLEILNQRRPGFVENRRELTPKAAKYRPLPLRLEDWIDDHVFRYAKQEGWFNAITYAIRDPRYQSRNLLVAVRGALEESQAAPISIIRRMERYGCRVR